jgi:hypothetical protein
MLDRKNAAVMDAGVEAALVSFARACRTGSIDWQLGGSGLLHALGLVDRVRDLDVVFRAEQMEEVGSLVRDHTGLPPSFEAKQEAGFVSGFRGRHMWDGVELDMTAGIALDYGDRVLRLPFESGGETTIQGEKVPLAPLAHWLLIYRFHNPERAQLLEPRVGEEAWAALLGRLGQPEGFTGSPG